VLAQAGFMLASAGGDIEGGMSAIKRAVILCPNSSSVLDAAGWVSTFTGDQAAALDYFLRALRISPSAPVAFRYLFGASAACVLAGRYADAIAYGEEARHRFAGFGPTFRFLAAAYAQIGDIAKAGQALAMMHNLEPRVTIAHLKSFLPYQDPIQAERVWEGLRKAGLPQ
jgi:adenylate cyclase